MKLEVIQQAEKRLIETLFSANISKRFIDDIDLSLFVTKENRDLYKSLKSIYDQIGTLDAALVVMNYRGTLPPDQVAERFLYVDTELSEYAVEDYILLLKETKLQNVRNNILQSITDSVEDKTLSTEELIKELKDNVQQLEDGESTRYSRYFTNDLETILDSYKKPITSIPTEFMLYNRDNEYNRTRFILPSGGITIIAAPTNHGKSKMLQSLTLDVIKDYETKVLYITYEENKKNVYSQFLNAYADVNLTRQNATGTHGNATTIAEYLHNGSTKYMSGDSVQKFLDAEAIFNSQIYGKTLLVVKPDDNYLSTFLGIVRDAVNTHHVKAVFVDYVQELSVDNWKASSLRSDELKEVMIQTDLLAQRYDLPIVMAAQLNRDTADSPLVMGNQSIADSAWIERKASEILLLWSNQKKCFNDKDENKTKKVKEKLPDLAIGTYGKMYMTLTKSRNIPTGIEAIVEINGNTGRLHGNITDEERNGNEEIDVIDELAF